MDLLRERLPEPTLTPDVTASAFLDRCASIASQRGWSSDRRREYAGPGYDQLNIHLTSADPGYPMIRIVSTPRQPGKLSLDVVTSWSKHPVKYEEYVEVLRRSFALLLDAYREVHGKRLRLGLPRRPPRLDPSTIDCNRVGYAVEKFEGLARTLATGQGDARERLIGAYWTFHVIRPADLPEPLRSHLEGIYERIARKPARHRMEGSVEATVRTMKNVTAAGIIERLLDIADALQVLEEICSERRTRERTTAEAAARICPTEVDS